MVKGELFRIEDRRSPTGVSSRVLIERVYRMFQWPEELIGFPEEIPDDIFDMSRDAVIRRFEAFKSDRQNVARAVLLFAHDIHPDYTGHGEWNPFPIDVKGAEDCLGVGRTEQRLVAKLLDEPESEDAVALMYDYFVIQQAAMMVMVLTERPEVKMKLLDTLRNLVIYRDKRPDEDGARYFFWPLPGSDGMNIYGEKVEKIPPDDHSERVMNCAHELGHAVFNKHTRLWKLRCPFVSHQNHLWRVLTEAYALSVEHEARKRIAQVCAEDGGQGDYLLKGADHWERRRLELLRPATRQPELHLSYSEGARLANRLKRNGWRLKDTPELLEKVGEVVDEMEEEERVRQEVEFGTSCGLPIHREGVPIDLEKGSFYLQVMGRVEQVRKEN